MRPLSDADLIAGASPLGAVPFGELGSMAAIDIPSKARMLQGAALVVTRPEGHRVDDPAFVEETGEELAARLGGWFARDLSDVLELYDSLASDELRAMADAPGITLTLEAPRVAYYFIAFEEDDWLVQAVGEPGDFHAASFSRPLSTADALGPGGHPRPQPAEVSLALVRNAASEVPFDDLRDETSEHPPNVYDLYRSARGVVLKSGVRMRLDAAGAPTGGATPLLHVVRLDLDLVR